jgi:hypothetical protein
MFHSPHSNKKNRISVIHGTYLDLSSLIGTVVVVIAWLLDLQLPIQSVIIITNVVSLNPAHARCTYNHHGTRCAGEIAAVANSNCAVGVAYHSKVSGEINRIGYGV